MSYAPYRPHRLVDLGQQRGDLRGIIDPMGVNVWATTYRWPHGPPHLRQVRRLSWTSLTVDFQGATAKLTRQGVANSNCIVQKRKFCNGKGQHPFKALASTTLFFDYTTTKTASATEILHQAAQGSVRVSCWKSRTNLTGEPDSVQDPNTAFMQQRNAGRGRDRLDCEYYRAGKSVEYLRITDLPRSGAGAAM